MLIRCPECNHEVSDKAKCCPHCGYPISEVNSDAIDSLTKEECPICGTKEHILINGNDVCKQCGYVFQRKISNIKEVKKIELSSEECPICKSRNHLLKDDNDICAECGYIYKRNLSSPVDGEQNKVETRGVRCPRCGSTNVEEIQFVTFPGYALIEYWYCNSCHYEFDK